MANDLMTLTELVKLNDLALADIEVTDLLDDAVLLRNLHATTSSNGTNHKYLKETGAPVVGFRAPNVGREYDKSEDTAVSIDLKILDASFRVDVAIADAYTKGGKSAFLARELRRHLKAKFFAAEKQLIYGTDESSGGFTGLIDATTIDGASDEMVVNAAGDTADSCTSVYFIRTTSDESNVTLVSTGEIHKGETVIIEAADIASATKFYPAYYTPVTSWLALQIGSAFSVGRICNLDADHTLTDVMLSEALERFPSGRQPNLIVMHRKTRGALQRSRTTYSPTGAPAPLPSEYEGIPIITTDAISMTEAVVA